MGIPDRSASGNVLGRLGEALDEERPNLLLVHGDISTSFVGLLQADSDGACGNDFELFLRHDFGRISMYFELTASMIVGDEGNFKITTAADIERFREILQRKNCEFHMFTSF